MLTRLQIRNFKTLEEADIPLGQNVVLIGPDNSGKTSALQALALWHTGLEEWIPADAERQPSQQATRRHRQSPIPELISGVRGQTALARP